MANIVKSNIKQHAHGVITWTVGNESWTSSLTFSKGWGNGYIAIPIEHPFLIACLELFREKVKAELAKMKSFDDYLWIDSSDYNRIPRIEGQEWTFARKQTINDKEYYTFGFDTLHSWNNEHNSNEKQCVKWIEDYVSVANAYVGE